VFALRPPCRTAIGHVEDLLTESLVEGVPRVGHRPDTNRLPVDPQPDPPVAGPRAQTFDAVPTVPAGATLAAELALGDPLADA
jgi:hypothetical protein